MTILVISVLSVLSACVVVTAGRAIGGWRFERQLRHNALRDEGRLLVVPPIATETARKPFAPYTAGPVAGSG
ncbi:MAG: hypothetical protein QOD92_2900 [Acidimicrobiaceae bacterium]|jgi:hypothetical protein